MTVSAIGQGTSMSLLYGMQKPSASDIVEKILGNLDTNGDGTLSTDEINNGGDFAKRILKADANGDGVVTKDELLSDITEKMKNGMRPHPPPMGQMQQPNADDIASQIIDDLDTNGDGVLSAEEISKAGNRAKYILGADANGDGVVTKDELAADIKKNMASHKTHSHQHGASNIAGKIMDQLDSNSDGSLSTDEINNAGNLANIIEPADINGDGVVTLQELIAYLTNSSAGSQTQGQLNSLA